MIWTCQKQNSGGETPLKKAQKHKKMNYGSHPLNRADVVFGAKILTHHST
jgi:hypothetical protein